MATREDLLAAIADASTSARSLREVADAAQADYVALVRQGQAAGLSVPEIAAAAGVTRTGLYQALRRKPVFEAELSVGERSAARERARSAAAARAARTPEQVRAQRQADRRADLDEYRIERERQVRELEEVTGGYDADYAEHLAHGGAAPITYRQWLQGRRGATA
jgi:DNA-binding phage protein